MLHRKALVAATVSFAVLVVLVRTKWAPLRDLDTSVADDLNRGIARHPLPLRVWRVVTTAGGPAELRVAALVGAGALWVLRRRRAAVLVIVAMLGTLVLSSASKDLVDRRRPVVPLPVDHASGWSFPSGHALTSFVAMGLLLVLAWPAVRGAWRAALVVLCVVVVAAVGFSRMVLGVHYLSDVLGGWTLGAAWLLALTWLLHPGTPGSWRATRPGARRRARARSLSR